jgi:hypothetical protein
MFGLSADDDSECEMVELKNRPQTSAGLLLMGLAAFSSKYITTCGSWFDRVKI